MSNAVPLDLPLLSSGLNILRTIWIWISGGSKIPEESVRVAARLDRLDSRDDEGNISGFNPPEEVIIFSVSNDSPCDVQITRLGFVVADETFGTVGEAVDSEFLRPRLPQTLLAGHGHDFYIDQRDVAETSAVPFVETSRRNRFSGTLIH